MRTGSWPTYQFVAATLDDAGYDPAGVLESFPVLGERSFMSRSYADVIYDHIHPSPLEDSEVALSVSGLSRHPLGTPSAQAFVDVLRLAADLRKQTPLDPTKVVDLTLTSEDAASALPRLPAQLLQSVGLILNKEGVRGLRSWGITSMTGSWQITFGREIKRYLDLTIDRYLELVEQEVPSPAAIVLPTPEALASRDQRMSDRTPGVIVLYMNAQHAIRELRKLREEADHPVTQCEGPRHNEWRAKVRVVMQRALGKDASVLRDFQEIRYSIGVYSGAPGEDERDREYFADQVKTAVAYIDAAIYELELGLDPQASISAPQPQAPVDELAIFLVHGHDGEAKHHVARVVQQLTERQPVVLDEQANSGLTVIEKFELNSSRAAFAIVLLTPDDEGGPKGDPMRPRARQNVVFELGYFFARLGRGRVVALSKGDVELPSDISGIIYISLDKDDWPQRLAKEMRTVDGLNVDLNRL